MKIELHRRDAYATMLVMIHFDPPPKFRGLDPNLPVRIYHRNLPHWRQDGATYFVTFRLADSLPQNKLEQLKEEKARWEKAYPPPRSQEQWKTYAQSVTAKTESWLDQGYGDCLLEKADAVRILGDALTYFHNERYDLFASVIMPNHCHVIVKPLPGFELEEIEHSWKSFTAHEFGKQLDCIEGKIWQEESYDQIVRDCENLWNLIRYIGNNPRKAKKHHGESCALWINEEWKASGRDFPDPERES